MIYRHTDEQLQAYFDSPAINQSPLKIIIDPNGGIEKFVEQLDALVSNEDDFYDEKKHFIIGKAVDCIISQETAFLHASSSSLSCFSVGAALLGKYACSLAAL